MTDKLPDWMQEEEDQKTSAEKGQAEVGQPEEKAFQGTSREPVQATGDEVEDLLGDLGRLEEFIPSEAGVENISELAQFGAALQITDTDRQRIQIFQGLISPESKTSQPATQIKHDPQLHLRILFSLVMISLVLIPPIFSTTLATFSPPDIPSAAASVFRLIEGLPPDAPVLVAVEVEPALAGEMNMAAMPVLNHLSERRAILAFISSLPTGPAQVESMMNLSNAAQNQAIPEADRYINLGFIPGGTAGLQNFVQSPRSIIHGPIVIPAVQGYEKIRQIGSLAEFALLVVISDRPETARNWVEQVGPYLEDTSFVVILSAQAGPALQPYIETTPSQIQGAVIGLAGGMAYERLINQALIPFAKWSSFNLGLIAAVILMAGGGILNALRTHPSTRPPQPPSARGSDSDTNKGSPA